MDPPEELVSSVEPPEETAQSMEQMDIQDNPEDVAMDTSPTGSDEKSESKTSEKDQEGPEGNATATEQHNKDEEDDLPPLTNREGDGDDGSSTDTLSDDSERAGGGVASTEDANERLLQATQLKEEGNSFFSKSELDAAARCYRRGISKIKRLNKNNTGDAQVQGLLISLHNNLSMVLFRQEKFRLSAETATKALEIDPVHVKALYRRAVARRRMGLLEEARADLREGAKLDPSNTAVKKELVTVKKQIETAKEAQKKALAKAFASGTGSLLYQDKEAAEQRRIEEQKRQKEREQELYKKRKAEWEDECVSRMARNEPAITFEEWEKELKEKEEKERKELDKLLKEEEKKRKEEEQRRRKEEREARKAASPNDSDEEDDSEHLSEKEIAMMRGYKKTADGKTTSYFTRELSKDAAKAIGDIAPKRLDGPPSSINNATGGPAKISPVLSSVEGTRSGGGGSSRPSAWNFSGTWEEKDTTDWCEKQLRKRLEETSTTTLSSNIDASVVKVDELTGHASVAIAGGKKRYIFDFHCKLSFDIKDEEAGTVVASGAMRLPDICSTSHEEVEVEIEAWKERPSPNMAETAMYARQDLVDELRVNVQRWLNDFNEMY